MFTSEMLHTGPLKPQRETLKNKIQVTRVELGFAEQYILYPDL